MGRSGLGPILVTSAVVLAGAAVGGGGGASAATRSRPSHLKVGSFELSRCQLGPTAYCGTTQVPLDWQASSGPSITVCFRWYPATDVKAPALGTLLPVEGGPGYPTIGSVPGYLEMYGALVERYNLLAVDLRGTGCSTPIRCARLQRYSGATDTPRFQQLVGACGAGLDRRWKFRGGGYLHGSDLFTSAPAADDVAAVIRRLGLSQVSLYGDSYGSWFAQVFASRYPALIHSLILDSTYQILDLDPWYRSTIQDMPADFETACARSAACAAAGGKSWPRMEALAASLRAHAISGEVPGPFGAEEHVTMGVVGLLNLVSDTAEDPLDYRSIDAAARAWLDDGQAAPLLRLYAQRLNLDEAYFNQPVGSYSVGLYMAVSCLDYPQLYSMRASIPRRRKQLRERQAAVGSGTFAPFTVSEWLSMDQNTENFTACLDWPPPEYAKPPVAKSPPLLPANMPVLILGGELDTWTPASGIPVVEREIGGDHRYIEFANETHVVGEGDIYGCASSIIQAFVADPSKLRHLDASCAASVPGIRAVGSYPSRLGTAPLPTRVTAGSTDSWALRMASAGILTAGDAVFRSWALGISPDDGLYGGRVTVDNLTLHLSEDELVPGVFVSGVVTIGAPVSARLTVTANDHATVSLNATFPLFGESAVAQFTGSAESSAGGRVSVSGSAPAP
ncbi:MAG: alpha/beta fold hydrolase [Acidimicrobiales bacterium]